MFGILCPIWLPGPGRQLRIVHVVSPSTLPLYAWPIHLLCRHNRSQRPQVRICYPLKLCFHPFKEGAGALQANIGGIASLGFIAHACAVGAATVRGRVVGTRAVPRQANEYRACRAVVIIRLVKKSRDGSPDGGEVLRLRRHGVNEEDRARR